MRRNTLKHAVAAALIAGLVLAGGALAARSTSSLNLVVLGARTAASEPTEPSYGGQITFDVSTSESHPSVNVRCYQAGSWVYDGWQSFWPGYVPEPVFTLSSLYWTGGAADCIARLLYFDRQGRERTLTSLAFHVAA
jgi:hypothetical protein